MGTCIFNVQLHYRNYICKVEIIVIKYFVKVRYVCTKIYEYAYTVDSIKFRHPVNFAPL